MTDDGIGRILVASLHQSIGDTLPQRLEYYEHWLSPMGLRDGRTGRAPLGAVLSFLRQEGREAYDRVMTAAGRHAAEWHHAERRPLVRAQRLLPYGWRVRLALGRCRRLLRTAFEPARVRVSARQGVGTVSIAGSIFCELREPSPWPTCGYFAAAIDRYLALEGLVAEVVIESCEGGGAGPCRLHVVFHRAGVPVAVKAA
jgi:hypothetical protein